MYLVKILPHRAPASERREWRHYSDLVVSPETAFYETRLSRSENDEDRPVTGGGFTVVVDIDSHRRILISGHTAGRNEEEGSDFRPRGSEDATGDGGADNFASILNRNHGLVV